MKNVQKYILTQLENKAISQQDAVLYLKELKQKEAKDRSDIAIIGVSCRIPMADNTEEYWDNIISGRNCFISKPIEKLQIEEVYRNLYYAELVEYERTTDENEKLENYIGPFIKDFDKFDAGFFGIPPREAKYIDPQQRVFLEAAWSALEDAGYSVGNIKNTKTGVYVGRDGTNSLNYRYVTMPDPTKASGNWEGILASRINYHFNLRGPAQVIDTACSSGLVAVHEACNSLRNGECEIAIAGGIGMMPSCIRTINDSDGNANNDEEGSGVSVSSKDNRIRAFDKKGSGTVFGEGVVTFILKPLKSAQRDKDHIYAVIKGSAINSDGASNGITAPNPLAQEEVIMEAWENAKVSPETISYIETHGTGTLLGDPIEVLGITNAFSKFTDKKQFCGIGSVKTNIGHLIGAAGCANLLKVVLSMNHHMIPPSLFFEEPNPHINFVDSPIFVVDSPMEWNNGDQPLRAGVSAFGFSGTNCHMVVEEYKDSQAESNAANGKNIFTISARTLTAMENSIKRYNKFLKNKIDLSIEDICFTASTGRGHYGYRLAILVETLEELKEKISILAEEGLKTIEDKNIYYGTNRIVSDKSKHKAEGEISENDLRDLTSTAQKIVDALASTEAKDELVNEMISLCSVYVKGANVEWTQLYSEKEVKRVPLPTYPFDRTHYWGDSKISNVRVADITTVSDKKHPLVEKCLVESMTQSIYCVNFNLQKQWVLKEHKIAGNHLVSGTTHVEICKEALSQYYKSDNIVFEDIVFLSPLVVKFEDDDIETHIVITKGENNESFAVVSKHFDSNGNPYWIENVRGTAHKHNDEAGTVKDLASLKAAAENYEEIEMKAVEGGENNPTNFGPRWQCVKSIFNVKDEDGEIMCVEIELPNKLMGDLKEGYRYHPGMLDDAVNTGLQSYTGSQMYLPFSYKNMKVYKNLPKHFFSILRKSNKGDDSEIIGGSLILADENGNILAEIEECTLKKVKNFSDYITNTFYAARWVNQNTEGFESFVPAGNILIFKDKSGLADSLAAKIKRIENNIYFVTLGDAYKRLDASNYVVSSIEADYHKLLEDIGENNFSAVYHMSSIDFGKTECEADKYSEELNNGLYSLLYISKAFLARNIGSASFVLLADNAHEVNGEEAYIKPANTAFLALAKTTVAEFAGYTYRCIDIDPETKTDLVIAEILSKDAASFRIAYRKNARYKEIITTMDIADRDKKIIEVKENGVYIVTGGTGGLGLEVALNLGSLNKCNICLTARRSIPEREEWEGILERNENNKLCNLIRGIMELESRGCTVIVIPADASDYTRMSEVINELKQQYGRINGIIHCAGVAGDGFLFKKPMETFNNVIAPKIYGTVVLDALTRDQQLDFFVMFSSIQSILGGPGQGDYTAANAFLDTYAAYLIKKGIKAHAINWPGWSETGMAFDFNIVNSASVFKTLTTQTAINALNNIICYNLSNVVPGELDFEFLAQFSDDNRVYPIELSENLQKKLRRYQNRKNEPVEQGERRILSVDELVLLGKSEGEYTETEKVVGYIYAAVLNMPEIDIYENFTSMGGNSIIATEVLKVLNNHFDGVLNISDMFTYSCVEEISAYIDSKLGAKAEAAATKESSGDIMEKFESGDIDIDSMIEYFEEEQ